MTDREALDILEPTIKLYEAMGKDESGKEFVEAFKRAVEALKERAKAVKESESVLDCSKCAGGCYLYEEPCPNLAKKGEN